MVSLTAVCEPDMKKRKVKSPPHSRDFVFTTWTHCVRAIGYRMLVS